MIDLAPGTDAREVLLAMRTWDDECIPYVRALAEEVALPVEQVRQILRQFGEHGLATYGPVRNPDDFRPAGSTWWLTDQGAALRIRLEQGEAA